MIRFNNSTFENLPNWDEKFPPFIIEVDGPLDLSLKRNSYIRSAEYKPNTNITDKFLVYDGGIPLPQSVINEPLAREISLNDWNERRRRRYHGERIRNLNTIKRFVGYYEPLFKTIPMFRPIYYWNDTTGINSVGNNYVFADNLEQFATIDELMYSKVNDEINVLKLKNTDNDKSIYPMLDEIGLSQTSRNIFKSSWDSEFFIKTLNETDFLEEFITSELETIETPIYGQILSYDIYSPTTYYPNVNIYGPNLAQIVGDSDELDFDVTIKNLSASTESFILKVKYVSSLLTTPILSSIIYNNIPSNDVIVNNIVFKRIVVAIAINPWMA
jgi:hypothetical protein